MNGHDPSGRKAQQKASRQVSPGEERLTLLVDRITITGVELNEPESERFVALLMDELKRRLMEQFNVQDTALNAETLRLDLGRVALTMDQPGDLEAAVREVARRLALTLDSAAMKGKG